MKVLRLFLILGLVSLSLSCKGKNPAEQYGDRLMKTYKDSEKFGDKTSIQNLQESIKAFQAANGRYPNDLKELADFAGIPLDSNKYTYDPSTGIISSKE
ncbi:MAG TPA: hypothetical protein VEI96_02945 [Thermodesulfovibrionales bacterium]|nr:hypothetical protein [Thermodesulfovibrionales bacterium]